MTTLHAACRLRGAHPSLFDRDPNHLVRHLLGRAHFGWSSCYDDYFWISFFVVGVHVPFLFLLEFIFVGVHLRLGRIPVQTRNAALPSSNHGREY